MVKTYGNAKKFKDYKDCPSLSKDRGDGGYIYIYRRGKERDVIVFC